MEDLLSLSKSVKMQSVIYLLIKINATRVGWSLFYHIIAAQKLVTALIEIKFLVNISMDDIHFSPDSYEKGGEEIKDKFHIKFAGFYYFVLLLFFFFYQYYFLMNITFP